MSSCGFGLQLEFNLYVVFCDASLYRLGVDDKNCGWFVVGIEANDVFLAGHIMAVILNEFMQLVR